MYVIVALLALIALCLVSLVVMHDKFLEFCIFWRALARICLYNALGVFPRKKGLVVFCCNRRKAFVENTKYLFMEAVKQDGLRCVWISKNRDIVAEVRSRGYEAHYYLSFRGMWCQLRAAHIFITNSILLELFPALLKGATSINTWHGVGLKRSWFRNENSFDKRVYDMPPSLIKSFRSLQAATNHTVCEYVIATSETVASYYPGTYHIPPERILNLGQARNDVFYSRTPEEDALELLPESMRGRTVITYMPTHRNYGRGGGVDEKTLNKSIDFGKLSPLLEKYHAVFLVKQHHYSADHAIGAYTWPNIIDISDRENDIDPQLLLKKTDVLITDYSSCYSDYLLLDRPVLFYCFDLEKYLERWELNFEYDYVTPGPKVKTSDELLSALESVLRGEDTYQAERARVRDIYYSPQNQEPVAKKQIEYFIKHIL